jgi:hypothetical protein
MPSPFIIRVLVRGLFALWFGYGFQVNASPVSPVALPSAMDGRTFYEVLLGEMEW